jgi:hypothetical protein
MKGRDPAQNKKNETKSTVVVPEPGMPFGTPPGPFVPAWIGSANYEETLDKKGTYIAPVVPYRADHEVNAGG